MQYIHVKVIAGAGKESWKEKSPDHFEISVKEKAERNMANARVLELVASHFKVPVKKVRIVNGHRHPSKLIVVEEK
ncbi:MAG: DUF167 domain-containing protein [Patescibacteria group bacterium]